MRKWLIEFSSHPSAFREVNFQEIAVLSLKLTERMESLDDTSPFSPAAADSSGKRNHRDPALPDCRLSQFPAVAVQSVSGIDDICRIDIRDACVGRESILSQSKPPRF